MLLASSVIVDLKSFCLYLPRSGTIPGPASGGPIFSLRERKDWGEKSAFSVTGLYRAGFRRQIRLVVPASTGLPYDILLRAAPQLELDLLIVAF